MSNELCPHCRVLRNAVVSVLEREIEENGDAFTMIAKNYSCSMCNSFIRCEYTKHPINKNI